MRRGDKPIKSKAIAGFAERMNTAADAKKALLEKWWRNAVDVNDPAFLEQQAIRQAAATGRAERDVRRKAEKDAAKAQAIADSKAARESIEAQAIADQIAREAAESEASAALLVLRDQRKSARDARYAARKARK